MWAPTAEDVTVNLYESGTPETEDLIEQLNMEKDVNGHRYIERISEIVKADNNVGYEIRDILKYTDKGYAISGNLSKNVRNDIIKHLDREDRDKFDERFNI